MGDVLISLIRTNGLTLLGSFFSFTTQLLLQLFHIRSAALWQRPLGQRLEWCKSSLQLILSRIVADRLLRKDHRTKEKRHLSCWFDETKETTQERASLHSNRWWFLSRKRTKDDNLTFARACVQRPGVQMPHLNNCTSCHGFPVTAKMQQCQSNEAWVLSNVNYLLSSPTLAPLLLGFFFF